jgi:F0F1-type ATP synthase assembly protein I
LNGGLAIPILRAAKRLINSIDPARLVLSLQLALGCLISLSFLTISGDQSWAALIGTLTVFLPSAFMVWSGNRTKDPSRLLVQGLIKMASTVLLMLAALAYLEVQPLGFFAGLVIVQASYLIALGLR